MSDLNQREQALCDLLRLRLFSKIAHHARHVFEFVGRQRARIFAIHFLRIDFGSAFFEDLRHHLNFVSVEMCQQLAKYNVMPNKSANEVVPESLALDVDFWRGVVDGDGNVRIRPQDNCPCLTLTGSWRLIDKFADFLLEIAGKRPAVSQNHSIYQLGVGGSRARTALSKIYYDGCAPALDRKMAAAELCKSWKSKYRGESPKEEPC